MNLVPPTFVVPVDDRAPLAPGLSAAGAANMKWAALQEAGAVVCMLAGEEPERSSPEIRNFPAMVRDAGGWRRALAENGVDDLAALMEPGIAALLAVNARGIDATIPARALWREFVAARDALLALIPTDHPEAPERTA